MVLFFLLFLVFINSLASHPYEITLLNISENSSVLHNPALIENMHGLTIFCSYFKTKDWYGQEESFIKVRNIGISFQKNSFVSGLFLKALWNNFEWKYETKFSTGSKEKNLVILHQSFQSHRITLGINEKIYSFVMYKDAIEFLSLSGFGIDVGMKYKFLNYLYFISGINDIGYTKIENEYNSSFYITPEYIVGILMLFEPFVFSYVLNTVDIEKIQLYTKIELYIFRFFHLSTGIYTFDFFNKTTISYIIGLKIWVSLFYINYNFHYFRYPDIDDSQIINKFSIKINL